MADEEVKPNEAIIPVPVEASEEVPAEAKQEELPLAASEETKTEEQAVEPTVEEPKPEEPKPDWKDKELKAKHRQLQEAKRRESELQRRAETAEALASKFNQSVDKQPELQPSVVPSDQVEKRAQELVSQQKYVEDCNKAAKDGETKYKQKVTIDGVSITEWQIAVSNLEMLGGFDTETMGGILASDDPAKALFELGNNPENYHRIMELSVPRRIIEIGKLAMQPASVKKVSEAPAPVNPVGGRAAPPAAVLSDDIDDDKWHKIREAQRAEYKKNRNSGTKFPSSRY
jgi:hypothetical protein